MTTPRSRALVSLAATMAVTLALGACVRAQSRAALDAPMSMEAAQPLAIRFENESREHVYVYLINARREWLLGRVEPLAVATLRIPEASLAEKSAFMQLAVIAGGRLALRAALDPRATFAIAQPASAILSQQWMFAQGQLTPLRLRGARVGTGHP